MKITTKWKFFFFFLPNRVNKLDNQIREERNTLITRKMQNSS